MPRLAKNCSGFDSISEQAAKDVTKGEVVEMLGNEKPQFQFSKAKTDKIIDVECEKNGHGHGSSSKMESP